MAKSVSAAERLKKWCEERYVSRDTRGDSGIIQLTAADLREAMTVALQETLDFKYTDNGIRALIAELRGDYTLERERDAAIRELGKTARELGAAEQRITRLLELLREITKHTGHDKTCAKAAKGKPYVARNCTCGLADLLRRINEGVGK